MSLLRHVSYLLILFFSDFCVCQNDTKIGSGQVLKIKGKPNLIKNFNLISHCLSMSPRSAHPLLSALSISTKIIFTLATAMIIVSDFERL